MPIRRIVLNNTIEEVVKDGLCTGCGTCVSLCPYSAIQLIKDDAKGVYMPRLNREECNQCGICLDVCPGYSVDFKKLNLAIFNRERGDTLVGNYLNCYMGHCTDYEIRYNSASGGMVTALLIFALKEGMIDGALVTKMNKENPLAPEPFIARSIEAIISAAKSKYCPVPANIALREILENEGKYAVVQLPCHLQGIRKAEMVNSRLKERIILHIGIFCSKSISFLGTEFQLKRMGIKQEEVQKLDYRGAGWPGSMTIELKNKPKRVSQLSHYYDERFGSFVPWRCMLCSDGVSELADISCGDAWLPELANDRVGKSVVVVRTKEGSNILKRLISQKEVELVETTPGKIIQSQGGAEGFSWKKRDLRVRLSLVKLVGKKVPIYNQELLPFQFRPYASAILLYLQRFLASRRSLWWLLDIYCSLLEYGNRIKSRLRL